MRCLVVGLGVQGRKRKAVAGADAVATVDPVAEGAEYRSVSDVPPGIYDAALVCTPDGAKPDLLRHLLGLGKHVLVEKPLLAPADEIGELGRLARSNDCACYTAYNHRFEPHVAGLKRVLDSGSLGAVYQARFFYGNGTARDVRDSGWRDQGMGVLSDLGSHLLDMVHFLFGGAERSYEVRAAHKFENRAFDHVVVGSEGLPALQLEMTLLSWRNTFTADVFAEHGSAHINCLCKWGPSTLTVRRRRLPSGKPSEESQTLECADPTWAAEYEHFRRLCVGGTADLENDLAIGAALGGMYSQTVRPGSRS